MCESRIKTIDKLAGQYRGGMNAKLHTTTDVPGVSVEFLPSAGNDRDFAHVIECSKNQYQWEQCAGRPGLWRQGDLDLYHRERGQLYDFDPKQCFRPMAGKSEVVQGTSPGGMFFQKNKCFRRIAARYDKLGVSFLACVYLAAIAILVT